MSEEQDFTGEEKDQEEIKQLLSLLLYAVEHSDNIHKILGILSKALTAKHILLSWIPATKEEIEDTSKISAKLYSETDDGSVVLSIVENKEDWSSHGQIAFSVISSLVTMARNDILDNYSEGKVEAYKRFHKYMKASIEAALDASTSTSWE